MNRFTTCILSVIIGLQSTSS